MTSSQMMLFGGGPPPATFIGREIAVYSSSTTNFGMGVASDSSQNIYGSSLNINASGLWYATKFNSSGANQWFNNGIPSGGTAGSNMFSVYTNVAVDSSGNWYGCTTFQNAAGSINSGYLRKVNTSGTIQWQRKITNTANEVRAQSCALDSTGANVVVGGSCTISGNTGYWIARYNSSGVLQWQRQLTGTGLGVFNFTLTVDSSGNVILIGTANSTALVVKYNSSGTLQWQKSIGGSSAGLCVGTDSSNDVYINYGFSSFTAMSKINAAGTSFTWSAYTNSAFGMPVFFRTTPAGNSFGFYYNGVSSMSVTSITSSGTNAWLNTLGGIGNSGGIWQDATNSYFYVAATLSNGSFPASGYFRLPMNGANTVGTLANIGPTSTQSYSAGTALSLTTPSVSLNSGSVTDAAGAQTDAAGDLTISSGTLSTGTTSF